MEKMRIEPMDKSEDGFILTSRGKYPAICILNHLRFHDTDPVVQMDIDWVSKGGYTNRQRKKMVARTINGLLRYMLYCKRRELKHTERTL